MARVARELSVLPGFSTHKMWRGHNREWNISSELDKSNYARFLNEDIDSGKYELGSELQAMTIMSNHTHEVYSISDQKLFSEQARRIHTRYGLYYNNKHKRRGKVAEDRFKTCLIENDYHEMQVVFYVHANPVRAGIVKDAKDYFFSTHSLYAYGKRNQWTRNVKLPDWYMRLGDTPIKRQREYLRLYEEYLEEIGIRIKKYLKKLFYGSHQWMKSMNDSVKQWRREYAEQRRMSRAAPS